MDLNETLYDYFLGILHYVKICSFDPLENMVAVTTNRTRSSHISQKPLILAKFWQCVKVFSMMISISGENFKEILWLLLELVPFVDDFS